MRSYKEKAKNYPPPEPRPRQANALRLLLMVHELHKAGFQRLRIHSGMAPNGMHWRCEISSVNVSKISDANLYKAKELARYTSGTEDLYFNWEDARKDSPRQLAAKFIERFPDVAGDGFGSDWAYAGWFVEMLGFAERDFFPVAFADYELPNCLADDGERKLPFPPPPSEDAAQ